SSADPWLSGAAGSQTNAYTLPRTCPAHPPLPQLRREFRMRMDFDEWKVPEDKSDSMLKLLQQDTDRVIRLRAQRTFKVAVLNELDCSLHRPADVINGSSRKGSGFAISPVAHQSLLSLGATEWGVDEVLRQEPDLQFIGA